MSLAYSCSQEEADEKPEVEAAHIFLQRVLYRINRLNHFWWVLHGSEELDM